MEKKRPIFSLDEVIQSMIESSLNDLTKEITDLKSKLLEYENKSVNKRIYQQKEVIKEYGIGHTTLKSWVKKGLPELWMDNRVYYDRQDIEDFLIAHKI